MPGVWPLRIRKKKELRKKKQIENNTPKRTELVEISSKFRM
jgi:hypothetical protein